MATTAPLAATPTLAPAIRRPRVPVLNWLIAAGWPLGIFGLVNLGAEALGILPLYFSPFGLPGWAGAVAHLAQLFILGAAFLVLSEAHAKGQARHWLAAFTLAYIALPFITPPLDSLQLAILCSSLFLLGFAAAMRVGQASRAAAALMTVPLGILGLSATMGLALSAAFTPPFAITQGQQTAL